MVWRCVQVYPTTTRSINCSWNASCDLPVQAWEGQSEAETKKEGRQGSSNSSFLLGRHSNKVSLGGRGRVRKAASDQKPIKDGGRITAEREVGLSVSTLGMFRMICQLYYKLFPRFFFYFVVSFCFLEREVSVAPEPTRTKTKAWPCIACHNYPINRKQAQHQQEWQSQQHRLKW